jgi:hypothetical protein
MMEPNPRNAVQNLNTFHAIAVPDLCISGSPAPTARRHAGTALTYHYRPGVEEEKSGHGRAPKAAA